MASDLPETIFPPKVRDDSFYSLKESYLPAFLKQKQQGNSFSFLNQNLNLRFPARLVFTSPHLHGFLIFQNMSVTLVNF